VEYAQGSIGRVFAVRLEEGEHLYRCLEELARRETIRAAVVVCLGGIRSGRVVTGPKQANGPIEPIVFEFDDAREFLGTGTIFWGDDDRPILHLHAAIGRGDEVVVGCPRGGATVFLVQEAIVLEVIGMNGRRLCDPQSGLQLLRLFGQVRLVHEQG